MTRRQTEERRALLLLLVLLVLGLGAQLCSRNVRDVGSGQGDANEGRAPEVGCSGEDIPPPQPEESGQRDATGGAGAGSEGDGDGGAAEGPAAVQSVGVPLVLSRGEEIPEGPARGHALVLGFTAGGSGAASDEPRYTWISGTLEGPWPLRVEAQLPVGLDLRVVFRHDAVADPSGVDYSGELLVGFQAQGLIEVRYPLTRRWP